MLKSGKGIKLSGLILLILILGTCTLLYFNRGLSDSDVVFSVNGEPVQAGEFMLLLKNEHVAGTYNYFKARYGAEDQKDFWTQRFGKEIPVEYARSQTLNEARRIKLQQLLMDKYGIQSDISYAGFLQALKKENASRKDAVAKGKAIYGPQEYDEIGYYRYVLSNNIEKLKRKIEETEIQISDDDLRKKYEEYKGTSYRMPDYIKVLVISKPFDEGKTSREQALGAMNSALNEIKNGSSFEEVAKRYNKSGDADLLVFDEKSARTNSLSNPELKAAVDKLGIGEISEIIDTGYDYEIIKCLDKKTDRYQSFEEVKNNVRIRAADENFEKMLDDMVNSAEIKVNDKIYNKIFP